MKTTKLQSKYYQFGNKGAVFNNQTHIAESGSFSGTTLCGTPMLSSNWAQIEKHPEIGCLECLAIYKKPDSEQWNKIMDAIKHQEEHENKIPVVIPDRFAEHMIEHFTNCLPPIIWGNTYVLCSEPYSFDSETQSDTYIGFYTKKEICYGVITTVAKFKSLLK